MKKKLKKISPLTLVPVEGRVVVIAVGIENYQDRKSGGTLPPVPYARNDAEGFSKLIPSLYPEAEIELLLDSDATLGNLKYALLETIRGLTADDLFIFYYAGHGFHGAGGNRVTVWDTHAHNVRETSLLLRDVLSDPLQACACRRALAFVDACASALETTGARDVLSGLDTAELEEFLDTTRYRALFLSCEPGQKSYPSSALGHGIWTAHLLKALRGDDDDALTSERMLTDVSLRDYLRVVVPRYVTKQTEFKSPQKPMAIIDASNSFVIRHVPLPEYPVSEAGDFSSLKAAIKGEYFESVETGAIRTLPGFKKKGHYVPDYASSATREFVAGLLAPTIDSEIQDIYEQAKEVFGLKARDVSTASGDGQGSVDTEHFRFWIESTQNQKVPSDYRIARRLELRDGVDDILEKLDDLFGCSFERAVIRFDRLALDYDKTVDLLEQLADRHGGRVKDEPNLAKVTYTSDDGPSFSVDFDNKKLVFFWDVKKRVPDILTQLRSVRLGLSTPSRLLPG